MAVFVSSAPTVVDYSAVDRTQFPTGALATTIRAYDEETGVNAGTLVSGTLNLASIYLPATTITSITFWSGPTAVAAGTNQWFCLVDTSLNVLRKTVDDTSTAWNANASKTLALSSTYTVTSAGLYYVGINVTAGTPPNLRGTSRTALGPGISVTPAVYASSTGSLTDPASLGASAGALTALINKPYAYVS